MDIPKFQYSRKLKGSTVLVRLDLNVPMYKKQIQDDTRIRLSLPTIEKLIERKAKIVILSHLGRPNGKNVASLTLAPIAKRLSELLGTNVKFISSMTFPGIKRSLASMKPGQVALLENIRFHKGEDKNETWFAESLASLGDLFVLDGFGVAHRDAPSVTGIPTYLPSYAGYLLQSEIEALEQVKTAPKESTIGIIGGAKIATKLPVINGLLHTCSAVLVGGAIVNTYLKAKGYSVGASLVDTTHEFEALQSMKHRSVITPIDVVVGNIQGTQYRVVEVKKHDRLLALPDEKILDIGPKTIQKYSSCIKEAKSIIWNGAMGYFEQAPYHIGTMAIARLIASRKAAFTVIGGGETIQAMQATDMIYDIDHISTGGGALLEYLTYGTLPGIEALKNQPK